MKEKIHITILGLGYVGLPLALAFSKKYTTLGFDINYSRIQELKSGFDRTNEVESVQLKEATELLFDTDISIKRDENTRRIFIITVPTPIDSFKKPDLNPLIAASKHVSEHLRKQDVVIYESTVYPGCTEEDCVPVLEKGSGLKYNKDFFCGYSPERINPGDKKNTLTKIKKITSGSDSTTAEFVDNLYSDIIEAGTFKASSIKVAEAAKLIENCQRDVNISFMNELALIFDKLNISTNDVLEAAGTKWNFLKFSPGLVGGHCISVDPYYMIQKAEELGYYPALIGAGRRINDQMGIFVANKCVKLMISKNIQVKGAKALILGVTFKENCSDIRNTKVIDIYNELKDFGLQVDISDPIANVEEVVREFNLELVEGPILADYQLIILAVPHSAFLLKYQELQSDSEKVVFDVKGAWPQEVWDGAL